MTHPEPAHDLDPLEAVKAANVEEYDDPTPDEVTDPDDPNYVEPAEDVTT